MFEILASWWGCVPELQNATNVLGTVLGCSDKLDMSNSGSAWFGLIGGLLIGLIISWWVYNRQKKTSDKQDEVIRHIAELEERHENILQKILMLDEKIDSILEKK